MFLQRLPRSAPLWSFAHRFLGALLPRLRFGFGLRFRDRSSRRCRTQTVLALLLVEQLPESLLLLSPFLQLLVQDLDLLLEALLLGQLPLHLPWSRGRER